MATASPNRRGSRLRPPGTLNRVVHTSAAPPRLLHKVITGRGATATVSYAHMHDDTTVTQAPDELWPDLRPKATPSSQWVVKSLTVEDQFAGTTTTTSYRYRHPRHGPDDRGRYGFRGFEEVDTLAPSGAKTVERFAFDVDWSGRQVEQLVFPDAKSDVVHSIARTEWTERTLFAGAVRVFFASRAESLLCNTGDIEATCTPVAAAAYTQTLGEQAPLTSTSGDPTVLLWQDTQTTVERAIPGDGDRRTTATFALYSDAANYRLRPLTELREHRVNGTWEMFGKTAKTWHPTYRVALTDEVWIDANDTTRAITHFVYDMATGNVLERHKPEQYGVAHTTLQYDSRKLFVTREINELGHEIEHVYEYGTGSKLETLGPNSAGGVKARHRIRVDGMGRPIEEYIGYGALTQTASTSYTDANLTSTPAAPASILVQRRIQGNDWTQEETQLDGHGRPIRTTMFVQGTAPADHVTSFVYANDGTLREVSVPDPSRNDAAQVTYTYDYDSLGRATSMRRPDATNPADRSGVDIQYDGAVKIATEVVGAAGGQPATTQTITDDFGRLVEVWEATSASTFAVTQYTYGPDNNVRTIVDPEGVTTTLTHDLAGRRTQIERHGRIWQYTYDRNGNLVAEQVPGSTGPLTDPDYTTTIIYDALDRPIERLIGQRTLSAQDQQAFGARTEVLGYDGTSGNLGRLTSWATYAPNATTPTALEGFDYDLQGNRTHHSQTFNGAGFSNLQRSFERDWDLLGNPRRSRYLDMVVGTARTVSDHYYDKRGLPTHVQLLRPGEPTIDLAVQTRNVAGLVKTRQTAVSTPMTSITSTWSYDTLGRVLDQASRRPTRQRLSDRPSATSATTIPRR
jgi:YD repeat-containing protein